MVYGKTVTNKYRAESVQNILGWYLKTKSKPISEILQDIIENTEDYIHLDEGEPSKEFSDGWSWVCTIPTDSELMRKVLPCIERGLNFTVGDTRFKVEDVVFDVDEKVYRVYTDHKVILQSEEGLEREKEKLVKQLKDDVLTELLRLLRHEELQSIAFIPNVYSRGEYSPARLQHFRVGSVIEVAVGIYAPVTGIITKISGNEVYTLQCVDNQLPEGRPKKLKIRRFYDNYTITKIYKRV